MLETDDVGPRCLKLEADAGPLDGHVERTASVLMRSQVSLLRRGCAGAEAETEAKGQKTDRAHKALRPRLVPREGVAPAPPDHRGEVRRRAIAML